MFSYHFLRGAKMDNKIYCERPCINQDCELNKWHIPKDMYVEKGIYPFCKNFISEVCKCEQN